MTLAVSRRNASGNLIPFGMYTYMCFAATHPDLYRGLRQKTIVDAADAYLYRFDKSLSPQFVREVLDTAARSIADYSGHSIAESGRLFQRVVRAAVKSYFATGWDDVSQFMEVNAGPLVQLRKRCNSIHHSTVGLAYESNAVIPVSLISLESLLDTRKPVMLKVYADYCSSCKKMAPEFEEAARHSSCDALFASLDGPRHPGVKEQLNISVYPTVLRIARGEEPRFFSADLPRTAANYSAFGSGLPLVDLGCRSSVCLHKDTCISPLAKDEHVKGNRKVNGTVDTPSNSIGHERLGQWALMLERQGIDELDALVRDRDIVIHMRIDEAIQYGGTSCEVLPTRTSGDIPPMCILLGGGMGAGKTTAVSAIAKTHFWETHGCNAVCVEADAFKQSDPFFHVLRSITPSASRIVHADSIAAAEELFLQAVNTRRDVVFDGTLSWSEYARQTVTMLRDTDYLYKRGTGYKVADDGKVTECYWEKAKKRSDPVPPYRVELVGVTIDASTAVARGIVRKMLTGRGVPVPDQLQSHALFSEHFTEYIKLVDAIYLFDMSHSDEREELRELDSIDGRSATAEIIAIKPGVLFTNNDDSAEHEGDGSFIIRNEQAYKEFLRKETLSRKARGSAELYDSVIGGTL